VISDLHLETSRESACLIALQFLDKLSLLLFDLMVSENQLIILLMAVF